MAKKTALIMSGAVARGAFEAGVLEVLSKHVDTIPVVRVVAASSGALNGSIYAAAIRVGAEQRVADRLVQLWLHDANWHNVLEINWGDLFHAEGLGTADRLLPIMRNAVEGIGGGPARPVELRMALTSLTGEAGNIGGQVATTFESLASFQDTDFDSPASRDVIFRTALGSGAFPVLFAPVDVPNFGLCVDGGAVNNTPVKHAIEGGGVERIIVVSPEPILVPPPEPLRGVKLVSQLAEILINERLYRDLHDAEDVNGYLKKLDALTARGVSPDVIQMVKDVFGWAPIEIVQIRPVVPLDGSAFSAFSDAAQMKKYIDTGRERAEAVLGGMT